MKKTLLVIALLAAHTITTPVFALDERPSNAADQSALAVTIYNNDLALIKDARKVRVNHGENLLAWRDVSARMQPETALLRSLDGKKLNLLEQNFDFDLLTPQKLLEKSVGETVRVIRTQPITGGEFLEYATVLSANNGVVLQFKDRVESGIPGRLGFTSVPQTLRDRPTLSMLFSTEVTPTGLGNNSAFSNTPPVADYALELTYLTGGLTWKADYVAELSAAEDSIDLNGWVTLTNTSGTAYPNARLQLIAGEVNRTQPERRAMPVMMKAMAMADSAPPMQEETLFEYHLYTLDRLTTLQDNQTKQVALLSAQQVKTEKEFRFVGASWYYSGQHGDLGQKMKPSVFMEFSNKDGNLGIPLPKGVVRVYKKDSTGRAQFIGEDRIDHTAAGETVKLKLGEAFDVTADKKQSDYQKISAGFNARGGVIESTYVMEIRNAKSDNITVKVIEPMSGDWQIVQESHPHEKEAARTAVWRIPVAAKDKTTLTWRVRSKY